MALKNAGEIDKNFLTSKIARDGVIYYNADEFDVYGVKKIDGLYRRMKYSDAILVSEKVALISSECAGGRVRFATDSPFIAILVKYHSVAKVPNYSYTATMGFDLYSGKRYVGCFVPSMEAVESMEGVIDIDGEIEYREYTLNFPVCSEICEVYVGVKKGCKIEKASAYSIKKPVVFYGSSTTQGACASRPGNTYENIISRALDCDYLNLGFWGNARGEKTMAQYVSKLEMSAFVYDYDYNAPSAEHLQSTHEDMFKIIRKHNPQLPIVILSAPRFYLNADMDKRRRIVEQTYENALKAGDKCVRFISGREMLNGVQETALADNIHPNDVGFVNMAKAVEKNLRELFNKGARL
ncbi:MAG: hypothetical protein IJW64_03895 [Clostridia bacterium]|nr:hypothetical protein [Clostridia bacterium]